MARVTDQPERGVFLIAGLLLLGGWCWAAAQSRPVVDVRLPATQCTPAQAQALVGVGPKTAATVAETIRAWDLASLPERHRLQVERFFRPD